MKMSGGKQFQMKMLSGNSVLLVEAKGFESEIFMPHISNGRISFQNVIPNRRCCNMENTSAKPNRAQYSMASQENISAKPNRVHYTMASQESSIVDRKVLLPSYNNSALVWRMSAGQELSSGNLPLAFSTPANSPIANKENIQINYGSVSTAHSEFLPPEQARSSRPSAHEVAKNVLVQLPSGIQVRRLYRNPTENTPKRVGRVVDSRPGLSNSSFSNRHNSTNTSGFQLPATPNFSVLHNKAQNSTIRTTMRQHPSKLMASATKWRKCITPIRTYMRKSKTCVNPKRSIEKKSGKCPARKPYPQTQGPKPTHIVELRKRKLLIDLKVAISPLTFKKQQRDTDDLKNMAAHSRLPANRRQYERSKAGGPFDMLTNSNRMCNLSAKLNQQFRNGCINKAASTYPKYKLLCTIPPLEQDEQTSQIYHQNDLQQQRTASLSDETDINEGPQ